MSSVVAVYPSTVPTIFCATLQRVRRPGGLFDYLMSLPHTIVGSLVVVVRELTYYCVVLLYGLVQKRWLQSHSAGCVALHYFWFRKVWCVKVLRLIPLPSMDSCI